MDLKISPNPGISLSKIFFTASGVDLSKKDAIVLIEWPERIKSMWSDDWVYISFKMSKKEPDVREVIIEGFQ